MCRSPGPVRTRQGARWKQGPGAEEDSPDDPPVEDYEQQTFWRLLPEQLRMLNGALQVSQEQEIHASPC